MEFQSEIMEVLQHYEGSIYSYSPDQFGLYVTVNNKVALESSERQRLYWYYCRETFHLAADSRRKSAERKPDRELLVQDGYFFACTIKAERVAALVERVEAHLKLDERSRFYKCNKADVLYIKPSYFWWEQPMRHQLLSIILRAGTRYTDGDDLLSAICKYEYGMDSQIAVKLFLDGHTSYCGVYGAQWRDLFQYHGEANIRKLLVKPGQEPKERVRLT